MMSLSRVRFLTFTVLLTLAVLWITAPVQKLTQGQDSTSIEAPQFSWQTEKTTVWNLNPSPNHSQSIISSESFLYKNENKTSDFVNPKFYVLEGNAITITQSNTGHTANDATIFLDGDVTLKHKNEQDYLDLNTSTLRYNTETLKIETDAFFTLTFPQGEMSGQGLEADLENNELIVKTKVNTTLYPDKLNELPPPAPAKNGQGE